jgi:hypothetical protein
MKIIVISDLVVKLIRIIGVQNRITFFSKKISMRVSKSLYSPSTLISLEIIFWGSTKEFFSNEKVINHNIGKDIKPRKQFDSWY